MLTRNIEKAREAYKKRDIKAAIKAHSVKKENHQTEEGTKIKSVVYGGLDGIITTFAVVAGVTGASLSSGVILILGFANLIADGISMAIGDYLSTKSEQEYIQAERKREEWEVDNYPEGELREVVEIYQSKGFSKTESTKLAKILSKNKKAWVDVMMHDELNLNHGDENPVKNAIYTFVSFGFFGFIPLLTYVVNYFVNFGNAFLITSILTGLTLFSLGAFKSRLTNKGWLKSGLEMLIIGGVAAISAYLIGNVLAGLA